MECTEKMLAAAVKKAVEVGLLPKTAGGELEYLQNWNNVRAVIEAALAESPESAGQYDKW